MDFSFFCHVDLTGLEGAYLNYLLNPHHDAGQKNEQSILLVEEEYT
jgi:hypothetical protein